MAIRRMVRECIRAGIAGVRIDDQPIESKRRTESTGIEVVPITQAAARYRAAAEMRDELDPDFVIMAQCYARDAVNGGFEDSLARLKAYEDAGADWVQLEAPHSIEEIKACRAAVSGPLSFMKGHIGRNLGFDELLELGINLAWLPGFTHHVTWAALHDFMEAFNEKGMEAWEDFLQARKGKPYPIPRVGPEGEGADKQAKLEARYATGGTYAR